MLSSNDLSVFILHHHINGLGNKNLRSIQEIMRPSKPAAEEFKFFCEGWRNLEIRKGLINQLYKYMVISVRNSYYGVRLMHTFLDNLHKGGKTLHR